MADSILLQRATPATAEVLSVEWLFEPLWPGDRLMANVSSAEVRLTDEAGGRARADALAAGPILAAGVSAASARIDGTWTELNVFVAVDLVELDGQSLVDVPYQERRRLLESVVREGEGLRLSPIVKHPVSAWLTGWREAGFTHYLARHQNSRYLAGEQNEDVLELPIRLDAPTGIIAGLVGRRDRTRRIRD